MLSKFFRSVYEGLHNPYINKTKAEKVFLFVIGCAAYTLAVLGFVIVAAVLRLVFQ